MTNKDKTARLAGFLYLILVITGIINLMYIPSELIVRDNAALTFENIVNSEFLFRVGIVCGIMAFLAFMLLSLVLYRLLHEVNKTHATLMVIFVLVSVPFSFVNMLNQFSVLTLISQPEYLQLEAAELQAQVMFYLDSFNNGIRLSSIFWGLWLLPFGYLVFKSGFLPKILGILLMMGCFGYLIEFFAGFLIPAYRQSVVQTIAGLPASVGEIGICLWMLIMGARTFTFRKSTAPA